MLLIFFLLFCARRINNEKIVPAGIATIVPILTYGAMKKSPIHIPPSFVIYMNVLGRSRRGTDCDSDFSFPRSSV